MGTIYPAIEDAIQDAIFDSRSRREAPELVFEGLAYDEITYEILGVKKGLGGMTVTRSTTSYLLDHEGVFRSVPAGSGAADCVGAIWQGSRVVENLLSYSEDFSKSAWTKQNGATVTGTNIINLPADTAQAIQLDSTGVEGDTFIASATLSGSGTLRFGVLENGTFISTVASVTLSSTPTRYSVSRTLGAGATGAFLMIRRNAGDTATAVTANYAQLENSTGRSDTATPSEYVPTDIADTSEADLMDEGDVAADWTAYGTNTVADDGGAVKITYGDTTSGAYLLLSAAEGTTENLVVGKKYHLSGQAKVNTGSVDMYIGGPNITLATITDTSFTSFSGVFTCTHATGNSIKQSGMGAGESIWIKNLVLRPAVPETKYYANANGNSVASNVVTEATGSILSTVPSLLVAPALTNECLYSNNITGWTTVADVNTQSEVGLTGEPNTARLLTKSTAGEKYTYKQNDAAIADDTDTHAAKFYILKDGITSRFPCLQLSLTGGVPLRASYILNTNTGATNTTNLDTGDGDIEVNAIADVDGNTIWWEVIISATNDNTGNINIRTLVEPSWTGTWGVGATRDDAVNGSVTIGNIELYYSKTIPEIRSAPPIFTTSAAVTTGASYVGLSTDNLSDANGIIYYDWYPYGANEALGSFRKTISFNSGYSSFSALNPYRFLFDLIAIHDNTNSQTSGVVTSIKEYKVANVYHASEGKMVNVIDGSERTEQTYDGSFDATEFTIMPNVETTGLMKNLQIWRGGSYQQLKAKAEELTS